MHTLFMLNIYGDNLLERIIESQEYERFNEDVETLVDLLDDDLYLEAMQSKPTGVVKGVKNAYHDAKAGTQGMKSVWSDTTDAGGSIISGISSFIVSAIALCARVLKWACSYLSKIPTLIAKLIDKIGNIPGDVRSKIRGDIQLHIQASDLPKFYKDVFPNIRDFITLIKNMSIGNFFSSFFKRRSAKGALPDETKGWIIKFLDKLFIPGTNDHAAYKRLVDKYESIKKITLTLSTVNLSDIKAVNAYFTNTKVIVIDKEEMSYMEALNKISEDLLSFKPTLTEISDAFYEKISRAELNASLAQLSKTQQENFRNILTMISTVSKIIGQIVNDILKDINTINHSTDKVLKKNRGKLNNQSEEKKDKLPEVRNIQT